MVEDALARIYRVASDKRVAFRSRIKHFQRLRFPPGTNTGKGKPASFTFNQFMKLTLAFELVQSGLAPSTASIVVAEWWHDFSPALTRSMVDDALIQSDPKAFPCRDLIIAVYFDAMWQLGSQGPVDDTTEYFGLVKIVAPDRLADALADENYAKEKDIDSPWRALVIDARWLLTTALACATEAGLQATESEVFDDMLEGDDAEFPYALKLVSNGHP